MTKFRSKNPKVAGTLDEFVDAHQWNPAQPKSERPKWFNDLLDSGEVIHESSDSISLPFPAPAPVLPGQYLVRIHNGTVVAAGASAFTTGWWEPVEETK